MVISNWFPYNGTYGLRINARRNIPLRGSVCVI